MTEKKTREVLNDLQKKLQDEAGYKTEIREVDGIQTLRVSAPLYEDGTGYVFIELCALDYDEYFELFQVFTTIIPQPGPGLDELRKAVSAWNLTATLGTYGIFEELGQLYHKYNVVLGVNDTVDMISGQVMAALYIAMNDMEYRLADAINLSSGKKTFME